MKVLSEHSEQIKRLCHQFDVKTLFAFGSVLTDKFNENSDIDLLVDIFSEDPLTYSDNYFGFKFELEKIFNRKIDLLEQRAIRNPFFKLEIDKTKVVLYGN